MCNNNLIVREQCGNAQVDDFKKCMLIREIPVRCKHLKLVQEDVKPSADGCKDCLKIGDSWVHLRLCLICGHVGCCDSSKNKHATKHFRSTEHSIVQSFEPNEDWKWCYVDETFL